MHPFCPFRAALLGDLDGIRDAISNGVHVDATDGEGFTMMHHAIRNSHVLVVKYLIDQGATVCEHIGREASPLSWACNVSISLETFTVVLDASGSLLCLNEWKVNGTTPLKYMAMYECHDKLRLVLNHKNFVHIFDNGVPQRRLSTLVRDPELAPEIKKIENMHLRWAGQRATWIFGIAILAL